MRVDGSGNGRRRDRGPRLSLLGCFDLDLGLGSGHVDLPPFAQRLVAYLAVHDGPIGRMRIAGALWPDVEDAHAQANLRTSLWRLRVATHRVVHTVGGTLRFAEDISVDLHVSEALAAGILHHGARSDPSSIPTGSLTADLLPDWDDEWLVYERERFHELRVRALEQLCDDFTACGAYADAVRCGLLAIEAEPFRETAHRAVIRTHLAEGNPAEAVRHFRSLARRLHDELGATPSSETSALVRELVGTA